jgi:hypothetical protein
MPHNKENMLGYEFLWADFLVPGVVTVMEKSLLV